MQSVPISRIGCYMIHMPAASARVSVVYECVAVCCSVLQCVAVCCSVLLCVAVCCSVLQCVAACCSVLQRVAACCNVLQCEAVYCNVLQCVSMRCIVLQCFIAVFYNGSNIYTHSHTCTERDQWDMDGAGSLFRTHA